MKKVSFYHKHCAFTCKNLKFQKSIPYTLLISHLLIKYLIFICRYFIFIIKYLKKMRLGRYGGLQFSLISNGVTKSILDKTICSLNIQLYLKTKLYSQYFDYFLCKYIIFVYLLNCLLVCRSATEFSRLTPNEPICESTYYQ